MHTYTWLFSYADHSPLRARECKFAGRTCSVEAVDGRQLCQQDDKDFWCLGVNTSAFCLADGHAVKRAVDSMQRCAVDWLFG